MLTRRGLISGAAALLAFAALEPRRRYWALGAMPSESITYYMHFVASPTGTLYHLASRMREPVLPQGHRRLRILARS